MLCSDMLFSYESRAINQVRELYIHLRLPILRRHVARCLETGLKKEAPSPDAGLLFCLYLIAGFPDIISIGSLVRCVDANATGCGKGNVGSAYLAAFGNQTVP